MGLRRCRRGAVRLLAVLALLATPSCGLTEPGAVADGWPVSSPAAEGMDGALLDSLVGLLSTGVFGEIHSLVVVRHGRLVLERYFDGWVAEDLHPMFSVSKSVTALLVGIAAARDTTLTVGDRLLDEFPERRPLANPSAWKNAITLGDLLTMRAGFEWDESSTPYGDARNPTTQLQASADWVRFMLNLPMADAPGTAFRYNSGCSVLLGAVVARRTGTSAAAFAGDRLFGPLGIVAWNWETGSQGATNTGWGLSLRPRDLAKIGQLVLDGGQWQRREIVPEAWVREVTAGRVSLSAGYGYGYQWWRLPAGNGGGDVPFALGWGDQFLFVAPRLDLVVVSTGANYVGPVQDQALVFVPRYVFAAVRDGGLNPRGAVLGLELRTR